MSRHPTPLQKTFLPFLNEEFRDVHNPDNMMPGINTCQLVLGHAMSFTGWHTENVNLLFINYHHSGKPNNAKTVEDKGPADTLSRLEAVQGGLHHHFSRRLPLRGEFWLERGSGDKLCFSRVAGLCQGSKMVQLSLFKSVNSH
ncbi:hypothetical protein GHT06_018620 [Daphnia sinensis]|uniref:JmjC domain-containing protein n=1 Tax=Daphnia sinensis TaxID=1820382 RepID=A0AAD5LE73_9CRUS|nr:hypothetical protein GHT06_018620 [Daphnia sinensis]